MAEMEEQAYADFADSSSWASMDPELKEVACRGDVGFLKNAIASSKPAAYFLSRFTPPSDHNNGNEFTPPSDDDNGNEFKPPSYDDIKYELTYPSDVENGIHNVVRCAGNILHLAIWHGRDEFVEAAMSMLPEKIIHLLLSQLEMTGGKHWNPLHVAVWKENSFVVELIANYSGNDEVFVAQDSEGRTPALLAIKTAESKSATILTKGYLAELIKNIGDRLGEMPLYWAVCKGLYNVVLNLLECQGTLCYTGPHGLTALHVMTGLALAPEDIQDDIFGKLLRRFPELITVTDNRGFTVLHEWAHRSAWRWQLNPQGFMRTFKYFFDHYPDIAVKLMFQSDRDGNNPLHVIATGDTIDDWAAEFAETLIDLYREKLMVLTAQTSQNNKWPWLMMNSNYETPLARAINCRRWSLAWCFIRKTPYEFLCIGDPKTHLMLPVQNGCSNFGPDILRTMIGEEKDLMLWEEILPMFIMGDEILGFGRDISLLWVAGQNILHSASTQLMHPFGGASNILHVPSKSPEELIDKVLHEFPSLITQPDSEGVTLLDKASADGKESLVQLMLRSDPSSLRSSPSAWIKACENGHVSVILVFIKHPNFRGFCRGRRDTPLHHIKLRSFEEYKEFLVIDKLIEEQKNIRDMDGATPLHKAIARKDMNLTEALLTDGADRTSKDKEDKTASDLLAEVCKHAADWYEMCKRVGVDIGIDPRLTTTYIQRETNLLEMRGALLVVAGLLATITFTAGFTLPGGLNNNTGEALLAKDAAFLVFLLADTYAMCCSMLVLFCLIWSMLSSRDKSSLLIDRSVVILWQSLYATLLAFMTGIFTVIFHKSLWATIVVFVMCSVIGISATIRSILFWLIAKMIPSTDTETGYQNRLLKALGKAFASKRIGSQESSTTISHNV